MLLGSLPPTPKKDHERARIWAASALAATALIMLMLLIGRPPRVDVSPVALRTERIDLFKTDVNACRAALASSGFETAVLPDVDGPGRCGYANAVELTRSTHPYSGPVGTSCALAAALALWERDVVAPSAERHFGQAVTRIELAGPSYTCRPIAGRSDRRLSEHAFANAVDISGFTLADGRTVTVARGWRGSQAERAFLREIRTGACDQFAAVLSPDYNRAHRDHLHFDLGRDEICR